MSDSDSDHYPPELWAYFRAGAAEMAEMAETAVAPTVVSCSEMDGEVLSRFGFPEESQEETAGTVPLL